MIRRLALLAGLLCCGTAPAHVPSESFSRWHLSGEQLSMTFTVAAREASRIPQAADTDPAATLIKYLAPRINVRTGAGGCAREANPTALAGAPGYLVIEARWRCRQAPTTLEISAFADLAADHSHYVTFVSPRQLQQHVLVGSSVWALETGDEVSAHRKSTFLAFLGQGFRHVLSGYDHLAFLLALLLLVRRLTDLAWMITGFTLGHSATLSLSALGFVKANGPAVEAVIGLTIALAAMERYTNTRAVAVPLALVCAGGLLLLLPFSTSSRSVLTPATVAGLALFTGCYLLLARRNGHQGAFRLLIAALFGLVHGFGFAGGLTAGMGSRDSLLLPLLGFNLGVELGQLLLVAAVLLTIAAARRLRLDRPALATPLPQIISMSLCGAGVFWFVERAMA